VLRRISTINTMIYGGEGVSRYSPLNSVVFDKNIPLELPLMREAACFQFGGEVRALSTRPRVRLSVQDPNLVSERGSPSCASARKGNAAIAAIIVADGLVSANKVLAV